MIASLIIFMTYFSQTFVPKIIDNNVKLYVLSCQGTNYYLILSKIVINL